MAAKIAACAAGTLIKFGQTLSRIVTESSLCVIDEIAAHLGRWIMAATRIRRGSGNAGARKQLWMVSDRQRSIRRRRHLGSDRRSRRTLQAPQPMQTHRIEQGNAAHRHAGEVEALWSGAIEAMPSRRFRAPWRAGQNPRRLCANGPGPSISSMTFIH
jgi:hypothetical protein